MSAVLQSEGVYLSAFSAALRPEELLMVSAWAERNRVLTTKTSAEPGPWRNERTPYLVEVMDNLSPFDPVERVVAVKGTQLGFTDAWVNLLGYVIELSPGPVMVVMESDVKARSISVKRVEPLLESTLSLRGKVAEKKSRDRSSTTLEKDFDGGFLKLAGANSSSSLRSESIRFLIKDELDAWKTEVSGQGDPAHSVDSRTDAFYNRKIYEISTPAEKSSSRIWPAYERSDMREYHVPCPECGGLQTLEWEGLNFEYDEGYNLISDVRYACKHCGVLFEERHKQRIMQPEAGARWIPQRQSEVRGYRLSSLYSPLGWYSWRKLVQDFLDARRQQKAGNNLPMKTWQMERLALPWEEQGAGASTEDVILKLRDERPRGAVPLEADVLIMSVDTQDFGYWYEVRAWAFGPARSSWLVRESFAETEEALLEVWGGHYADSAGRQVHILLAGIDTGGHRTGEVYDFCRRYPQFRPLKGASGRQRAPLRVTKIEYYPGTSKPIPGGLALVLVDTEHYKDLLSGKLQVAPKDPGAWMLHAEATDEYARQMCAEYRDERDHWQLRSGRDNHYWDTGVYNLALADFAGLVHLVKGQAGASGAEAPEEASGWFSGRGRRGW